MNPYQGLKPEDYQSRYFSWVGHNANESLSGIETSL